MNIGLIGINNNLQLYNIEKVQESGNIHLSRAIFLHLVKLLYNLIKIQIKEFNEKIVKDMKYKNGKNTSILDLVQISDLKTPEKALLKLLARHRNFLVQVSKSKYNYEIVYF